MRSPKVGSLVYATVQGLGILAKQFFDHGIVDNVFVLEHHCRTNHHEKWYPDHPHAPSRAVAGGLNAVRQWVRQQDVLLFFETPFDWSLIDFARSHGKRTLLMVMHECTPTQLPYQPDEILCPSLLDHECFPGGRLVQVPVVDPFQHGRIRTGVKTFVHNAGNGGLRGRNGTAEFLESLMLMAVKRRCYDDWEFIVRSQVPLAEAEKLRQVDKLSPIDDGARWDQPTSHIRFDAGRTLPASDLWAEGDASVFPEKFNGLSLPMQEAYAAGMIVMGSDRFPMNEWLPREALIPTSGSRKTRVGPGYREFDEAIVSPVDIANKMIEVSRWPTDKVAELSERGIKWGQEHSWDALRDEWMRTVGKDAA